MSRKGLAAASLLVALSARAQTEIRAPAAAPPAPMLLAPAPAAPAPVPLAALGAPPALPAAAVAAAASVAAAPAAAVLPPEARAAALSAALADFARTDLKSASSGEARDAGETLMLRALGANASDSAATSAGPAESGVPPPAASGLSGRRAEPKVYRLSKPLRETVRLGPVAVFLNVAFSATAAAAEIAFAYKTTGSIAAAAAVLAYDLATSSCAILARSYIDLGLRYWWRKGAVLKEVARAPGVSRVKVLTTANVAFAGPLPRGADNTGWIFIEAAGGLPETVGRFGSPVPLGDAASNRVRLAFVSTAGTSASFWTPTLKDLLDRRAMPPEIAAAWRAQAKGAKKGLKSLFGFSKGKERIDATEIGADGNERPMAAIAQGPAARRLVGLGRLDRVRALLGWDLPSRAIPLSDVAVERAGDARGPGLKNALSRAWRRLTGRLIVVKS